MAHLQHFITLGVEVAPPHIAKRQPSEAPSKGHSPAIQAAPATPSKRSAV